MCVCVCVCVCTSRGKNTLSDFIIFQVKHSYTLAKNWALNTPTNSNGHINNYYPSLAVDGDRSNDLNNGSCTQTESTTSPWWQVHLTKFVLVDTVIIVFREDFCGMYTIE